MEQLSADAYEAHRAFHEWRECDPKNCGTLAALASIEVLVARVRALEAALPDPGRLELLADWIDSKYPDEPEHRRDVQYDLRSWAQRIRTALAGEG